MRKTYTGVSKCKYRHDDCDIRISSYETSNNRYLPSSGIDPVKFKVLKVGKQILNNRIKTKAIFQTFRRLITIY